MQDAIGQNQVLVTADADGAGRRRRSRTRASILQPHVVDCVLDPNDKVVSRVGVQQYKRAIDPATAATMTSFMLAVVNDPQGTGTAAQIPGVQVAGKTGTAETATGEKPHVWFIAFAPADHPKYAIAVLVEHGGSDAGRGHRWARRRADREAGAPDVAERPGAHVAVRRATRQPVERQIGFSPP